MKAIRSNLREAIVNRGFLIGMVGVVTVLFLASLQDIFEAFRAGELLANGFHHTTMTKALTSDAMTLALPLSLIHISSA